MVITLSIVSGVLLIALATCFGFYLRESQRVKLLTSQPEGSNFWGEEEPELNLFYTDKEGNNWLEFANPLKVPARRGIQVEIALKQADMNITAESLADFIAAMKAEANEGNVTRLYYLLERLEERLTWCGETQTLERVARLFFVLEGEPVDRVSEKWAKKKEELLKNDPDLAELFLTRAFKLTKGFSDTLETDILTYLSERAVTEGLQPDKQSPSSRFGKPSTDMSTTSTTKPPSSRAARRKKLTASSKGRSKTTTPSSPLKSGNSKGKEPGRTKGKIDKT
jgi:hypothetical protein